MMNGVVSIKSGIVEYYFDYISESFCFNALQHKEGKTFTSSMRVLQKILSLGSDYFSLSNIFLVQTFKVFPLY